MVDYANPFAQFNYLLIKDEPKFVPAKRKRERVEPLNIDWQKITEAVSDVKVVESRDVATIKSSDELGDLVALALQKQKDILKMELNQTDENFGVILRAQVSVCEKILTTQTKVDENVLRATQDNRLGDILEKFLEAEKQLNLTVAVS